MRISGGTARGARLKAAPGSRPTSERVRQAVFSSLGSDVVGARVLDLYCGSGAYALESISRGAVAAVLVDGDARAVAVARGNARSSGLGPVVVRRMLVERYTDATAAGDGPFDLVFCDPPYVRDARVSETLGALDEAVRPGATAVVECRSGAPAARAPRGWILHADKRYGDTRILMFRRSGPEEE